MARAGGRAIETATRDRKRERDKRKRRSNKCAHTNASYFVSRDAPQAACTPPPSLQNAETEEARPSSPPQSNPLLLKREREREKERESERERKRARAREKEREKERERE